MQDFLVIGVFTSPLTKSPPCTTFIEHTRHGWVVLFGSFKIFNAHSSNCATLCPWFFQGGFIEHWTEIAVSFQPGHKTLVSLLASLEGSADHEITLQQWKMNGNDMCHFRFRHTNLECDPLWSSASWPPGIQGCQRVRYWIRFDIVDGILGKQIFHISTLEDVCEVSRL